MIELKVKPLSVNDAWQGRRYKTSKYKAFEHICLLSLRADKRYIEIFKSDKIALYITFFFSSKGSDIDNGLKPIIDVLQKRYKFNDNNIYELIVKKEIVEKGKEGFLIHVKDINNL